jgi:hypothetical protein
VEREQVYIADSNTRLVAHTAIDVGGGGSKQQQAAAASASSSSSSSSSTGDVCSHEETEFTDVLIKKPLGEKSSHAV